MSDDIIVIGRPEEPFPSDILPIDFPDAPGGSGNPANHPAVKAFRQNQDWLGKLLKKEDDVMEDDIVVTAKTKFSEVAAEMANWSTSVDAANFHVPCFGNAQALRWALLALRFNLTNRDFGTGRAGANYGDGGEITPVDINVNDFKAYLAHGDGGAGYLIGHEMAHSLKVMRDFAQQKFNEFLSAGGSGMTLEQARAAYSQSPQFAENEQRANTIGRAIYNILSNGKDFGFEPTHGYASC